MIDSWSKATLNNYIEINNTLSYREESSEEEVLIELVSIMLDVEESSVKEMPYSKFSEIIEKTKFVSEPIPYSKKQTVKIDGITLKRIEFKDLEFGAFVDLELLLTSKEQHFNNLPEVFSTIYRRIEKEGDSFDKEKLELYSNWSKSRSELFEDLPIIEVHSTLVDYLAFRTKLMSNYEGLFSEKEEFDEPDYTGLSSKEVEEIKKEERVVKWGWHILLLKLANNNPLKIDEASNMPLGMALNILSMMQELKIAQ